jgi:hypothetical protein
MFMANTWQSIFLTPELVSTGATMGMWNTVFQYLPFISIVLAIIFAIVVFAKGGD